MFSIKYINIVESFFFFLKLTISAFIRKNLQINEKIAIMSFFYCFSIYIYVIKIIYYI